MFKRIQIVEMTVMFQLVTMQTGNFGQVCQYHGCVINSLLRKTELIKKIKGDLFHDYTKTVILLNKLKCYQSGMQT